MPFSPEILAGGRTLVFLVSASAVDQLLALLLGAQKISFLTFCSIILVLATICPLKQGGRQ
jgi:hypothetical protein